MSTTDLDDVFVLTTTDTLPLQADDGGLLIEPWSPMLIHCWALCYANPYRDNPHYRNPTVLAAFTRFGDWQAASLDLQKGFVNNISGWDEWRLIAWMEATELLRDELDAHRIDSWTQGFIAAGEHVLSMCIDMDTFDGAIPNHGIWNHTMLYRIGQLYDRPDMMEMAAHAFARIFERQTADGCFREGGSFAGFPGSPVTLYNIVSAMAINMYHGYSDDPAALAALEKCWHWYYNTVFPDFSISPAMDCRVTFVGGKRLVHPAHFSNKPEMRAATEAFWKLRTGSERSPHLSGPSNCQGIGFLTLQADKIAAQVDAIQPRWPEYWRMQQGEACIRRRSPWHAALCGISNAHLFTGKLPLWKLERQSLVNIYHEQRGLLIGGAHSIAQEDISLFSFYEQGSAHYLHDHAYLKSTPPLDTLILQYRGNTAAVSVDTTQQERCTITLSIHGELGQRPDPGPAHNLSAVIVKARLSLRLATGDTLTIDNQQRTLGDDGFLLRLEPGQTLTAQGMTLTADIPWTLRWPVTTHNPYAHLQPAETLAIAEAALWHQATNTAPRPTVQFVLTT